ncbi:MAG: hypothetical protein ABJE95_27525 [Byssovorax sp.]
MTTWILTAAVTLWLGVIAFIVWDVRARAARPPTRAAMAAQLVSARDLVDLALLEESGPVERAQLRSLREALGARLAGLSGRREVLENVQAQNRCVAEHLLSLARPRGRLEAAANAWLAQHARGGAS